ncbi:hypothetical protein M3G15_05495 [Paenibacillus sp. p3-SID1389]|uniref:hypothetical protein n=1 Tax=Paenibacillus sp. p3-SID1389 TaxID=2916364 RepID=UPI0021A33066|nr:hypothetical protein [Paenibacillus sp. p3-SID1389]MCT2194597.1 hypothetical protein [Paenibacillus sp. p3-SID1389]
MVNALSKITAALLAVLLLFLFPALQAAQRQEDLRYLAAYHTLVQFADAVRNKGFVTPDMYEDFVHELELSGGWYEVELEHRHKIYHPEYGDPADPGTFLGDFSVVYNAYYTSDILKVLFPSGTGQEGVPYKLEEGDFFTVTAYDRSRSPLDILSEFLYNSEGKKGPSLLTYGGMVLNEDY